jgi:hypothetical protein
MLEGLIIPEKDIFEISLLGTGGGYGESIVLHLGNNNWIVVDSCINPYTKECLPLIYLRSKGVDLVKDVKLIICTHWHDDHILGISNLFESCKSAGFCMARTTDTKKFLQFVGLDFHKSKVDVSASSTIEISKCFDIVKERKLNLKGAEQDKLLWSSNQNKIISRIFALSPSDFIINSFESEISTLITEYGTSNRKIVLQTPNEKSVALYISVNNHSIILGSDLEVSKSNDKGWLCILDHCHCIDNKSSLFKIPHHGSKNGYHERIWSQLLKPNPIAKLTPYSIGRKLPNTDMIDIFKNHTDNLYITSKVTLSKDAKKRERSISKAINKFNDSLREVKFSFGVVCCSLDVLNDESTWSVNLIGDALKIP